MIGGRLSGLAMFLVWLGGCAARDQVLVVGVEKSGEGCVVQVEGRRFGPALTSDKELLDFLQAQARRRHRALVQAVADSPYRCVGGAVFMLQRAGFRDVQVTVDGQKLPMAPG